MEAWWPLLLFVLFMVGTPGPANLLLMTGGARVGLPGCLGFILGMIVGKAALNLAIGLGLGVLLNDHAWLQITLKLASAAYMIWLAVLSWNPRKAGSHIQAFTFAKGVLVHPLNPKAWVMLLLAWSDFAPDLGALPMQIVLITGTFAAVQLVLHTFWCGAGQALGRALDNSVLLGRVLIVLTVVVVLAAIVF